MIGSFTKKYQYELVLIPIITYPKKKGFVMGFALPTFNLTCNIWRYSNSFAIGIPPVAPPDVVSVCNLALGRRIAIGYNGFLASMWLLLPPLTDIRVAETGLPGSFFDVVEVPAGSGRFYAADFVDDAGKGFANEHRVAAITMMTPIPVPLT